MKTFVLTLSKVFPATHPRKGEPTLFKEKFRGMKLHTIRANYELWRKRFDEIEAGRACLSVRQWTGKPYRSKQVEIACLTREDGIGLQSLSFGYLLSTFTPIIDGLYSCYGYYDIATNDGLSIEEWTNWFRDYDKTKQLAIIHFTDFRY